MNLDNAMDKNPYAFSVVCLSIIVAMAAFFAGFTKKYYQLKADTSSAQSFTLLKNFFTYVDDLEYHVFSKRIEKTEFKDAVEKITGLKITERESEYLFKMIDANKDGLIDTENELVLYTPQKEFKSILEDNNSSIPLRSFSEDVNETKSLRSFRDDGN